MTSASNTKAGGGDDNTNCKDSPSALTEQSAAVCIDNSTTTDEESCTCSNIEETKTCPNAKTIHCGLWSSSSSSFYGEDGPKNDILPLTFDDIMQSTTRRGLAKWASESTKRSTVSPWASESTNRSTVSLKVSKVLQSFVKNNWFQELSSNNQETQSQQELLGRGVPLPASSLKYADASIDNFRTIMGIREGEKVLMLTDPLLDPRVISAFESLAYERGAASFTVHQGESTRYVAIPDDVRPIVANHTFVISTWFASVFDPFCQNLRRKHGQRWVKITLFRNLDLWQTPMAAFPLDVLGEIVRATQRLYPAEGPFDLHVTDPRGTDLHIPFTKEMRDNMRTDNRWRGHNIADEDGCYVHYLPIHGPNLFDPFMYGNDQTYKVGIHGIIRPQWSVGFQSPFTDDEIPQVEFQDDRVIAVNGNGTVADILRQFLIGGTLEEFGCGHNPKAPRFDIYPAGPNSPGSLHFGINGVVESSYFKEVMPDWEEPFVHLDLVCYDCTVRAGNSTIVDKGHLMSLNDPKVLHLASAYGDPTDVLRIFPV